MKTPQDYDEIINSPVGFLGVKFSGKDLSKLAFLGRKPSGNTINTNSNKELTVKLKEFLDGYFNNPHDMKQPGTVLTGTDFQQRVWRVLASIKPGTTRSYGDIAKQLNTSPRAVGNACRTNPVPIFIPCHRVVSLTGRGGFMGHTSGEPLAIKDWLLSHEKNTVPAG